MDTINNPPELALELVLVEPECEAPAAEHWSWTTNDDTLNRAWRRETEVPS
jgi:hypothetical protein